MECQKCDSKKLFKVFDGTKRKRSTKKRDGVYDANSTVTDGSISGCQTNIHRVTSTKASFQELSTSQNIDGPIQMDNVNREKDSSPSVHPSPEEMRCTSRSLRRHRRHAREGISLALKPGLVSTPRSVSPLQDRDAMESKPDDQDSFIYAFLKEAIKGDKKKQRHTRRHEERRASRDRETAVPREHRHHQRRHREESSRDHDRRSKEESPPPIMDQAMLYNTFAKLFAQITEKFNNNNNTSTVPRSQSNKSLQCGVESRHDAYVVGSRPTRIGHDRSRDNIQAPRIQSQEEFRGRIERHKMVPLNDRKPNRCTCCYNIVVPKYANKLDTNGSRLRVAENERCYEYPDNTSFIDHYRTRRELTNREYERRNGEDHKRRYFEQKASRSFDTHREGYPDEEKYRRTARSDCIKEKHYDEKYRHCNKYYNDKTEVGRDQFNIPTKHRRIRKNMERFERNSIASRGDDYKDEDRYSDRDCGVSAADGETSTICERSNYLQVMKQEIAEQREAMDKIMKLWNELMKCFRGCFISQTNQGQDKGVQESAQNAKESAAAQLRLWRECMRRYETVARDVGDTDAKLMEELNKQRSEMAEMANMWQECLQRYRAMSNDFNSLKQKLVTSESPTRIPAPETPLISADGEGIAATPYRIPANYPTIPPMAMGYTNGSPLRTRVSASPAWWWCGEGPRDFPRRRSSPDSRGSTDRDRDRDRDRRHRQKDREDSRYKDKSPKPNAARSEHRHRKR